MYIRPVPLVAVAGLALLAGAAAAQPQQPASDAGPHHSAHHAGPPAPLTVDDYLNCVRGCNQIFGAVEGAGAGLECIRGCRWTSSRETVVPETERQ
jgi:hypothetical protein